MTSVRLVKSLGGKEKFWCEIDSVLEMKLEPLLCIVAFLQTTAEARVGRNKNNGIQSDSPQTDYDEYDAEYDYDYDNGTEISKYYAFRLKLLFFVKIQILRQL